MAFNLEHQRSPVWLERASLAARLLKPLARRRPLRIADIGCGDGKLEAALSMEKLRFSWTGFDLLPQSGRVRPFDVSRDLLPAGAFDVAIVLGVLEYLDDPVAALTALAARTACVLFSHQFPLSPEPVPGWVEPRRTMADWTAAIHRTGLTVLGHASGTGGQTQVWLCRGTGGTPALD